jgi:TolB-like protein/tetratricopeptide (TPR) repeat protein
MNKQVSREEGASPRPSGLGPGDILLQVERLKNSQLFCSSEKLSHLLGFIVEQTIKDHAHSLKESVIGNTIYSRSPPYDPRIDSTVRVEARRLRRKLEEYYAGEGSNDPIRISLPTGGYTPTFALRGAAPFLNTVETSASNIFREGPGAAVAVMPFRALSGDPDDERIAADITELVLFSLADEQGYRVISQRLALYHWQAGTPPDVLATELGVVGVLEGTVRTDRDMIRLSIELSNENGFVAFSDRIEASTTDRNQAVQRIAATIVSRVRFDSSKIRAMQLSPGPNAVDSHAKVYRARQLLDRQTPAAIQEALRLFSQVSREAPDYARGYSGIADSQCDLFRLGVRSRLAALTIAKPAALRALEIDPESAEAHAALATVHAWLERDRSAAEAMYKTAMRLGNHARTFRVFGVFLTLGGRHKDAEAAFRQAREIEPLSIQLQIAEAIVNYQARQFQAFPGPEQGLSPPSEALCYTALGRVFGGDPEGARALIPVIEQSPARQPDLLFAAAEIAAWLGDTARALRIDASELSNASFYGRATLWASLGEESKAIAAIKAAIDDLELSTAWLKTDIRFDRIRASAGFKSAVETLEAKLA